jgi:ATP synthase protein I
MALAVEWVSKITTVALEMALPAIGGGYLDRRLGTNYWSLAGLILGFVVGMWHLLQMTKASGDSKRDGGGDGVDKGGGANE